MISNQMLQSTLDGLKGISQVDFCVIDSNGQTVATTSEQDVVPDVQIQAFAESSVEAQEISGVQFFKVYDDDKLEYILAVSGAGNDVNMIGKLATFQLQNMVIAYRERYDRDNFIKNLLLDNLLLVDIYNRAKELNINPDARRVVMVLETQDQRDFEALSIVKNSYDSRGIDFVTAVDEKNVVIVKELLPGEGSKEIDEVAANLLALYEKGKASLSYGTIVREIKDVSRSYKEACMALDVGKIFFEDRDVVAYSSLGIGRLIYQLPIPLCKMFIKEIFDGRNPDDIDGETLETINKFFENSLNVSETSRQLYIHRNTLVYRLDKIQKTTGLDLRVFEDAITFKIALMVVKYMKYMEMIQF